MEIFSDLDFTQEKNTVITIGMFDGVHKGHQRLLSKVIEQAAIDKADSVVVTFWPHPRMVLHQDEQALRFLTSLEEKCMIFNQAGIKKVVILPFNLELASLTTEEFAKSILVTKLNVTHLVVGFNHRFGKGDNHQFSEYQSLAAKYNFGISKVEPVSDKGIKISSTQIRNYLINNLLDEANSQLGYHYTLKGQVVTGNQLGRRINYPTANVLLEDINKLIPKEGVYDTPCQVEGKWYNSMKNNGVRPTIIENAANLTIETHLFDFSGDLYNQSISVAFVKKLREEQRFESIDLLKQQLLLDEQSARAILTT